jgi:hypothetical protein
VATEAPDRPAAAGWEATRGGVYTDAGGEVLLPSGDEPQHGVMADLRAPVSTKNPRGTCSGHAASSPNASSMTRVQRRPAALLHKVK